MMLFLVYSINICELMTFCCTCVRCPGLRLAGERVVLVADPDVADDVMIRRAHLFVKEGTAFSRVRVWRVKVYWSRRGVWARQRRL